MTFSESLSHPLVQILVTFSLAQGVALLGFFWKISTAVKLGQATDDHLRELLEDVKERVDRLESEHFGENRTG